MDLFRNVLAQLSGTHSVIATQRVYIEFAGDLQGGVLLSQLIYWSSRKTSKDGWFYKTYADWQEEIYLPEKTVRRYSDAFEKRGFLRSEVRRNSQNLNIKHYRIDWEVLAEQMQNHFVETPANEGTSSLGGLETLPEMPMDKGTSSLCLLEPAVCAVPGKQFVPVPLICTSTTTSTTTSKEPEIFSEEISTPTPTLVDRSEPAPPIDKTTDRNLTHSAPPLLPPKPDRPWKTGTGSNDWDEGFLAHILKYLQSLQGGQSKSRIDAMTWINNRAHSAAEAHEILRARWDEYKAEAAKPPRRTDEEHEIYLAKLDAKSRSERDFIWAQRRAGVSIGHAMDAWRDMPEAEKVALYRANYHPPVKRP